MAKEEDRNQERRPRVQDLLRRRREMQPNLFFEHREQQGDRSLHERAPTRQENLMAAQAQQLHDMLQDDENLQPWVQDKITKAADYLEKAFKTISYEKGPGQGKL